MTLYEMSLEYEASAALLRRRLSLLRTSLRQAQDPEDAWHLRRHQVSLNLPFHYELSQG